MIDQNRPVPCPHRELAVGWALHALEPAEEDLVTAHLMTDCSECTRTVAETVRVTAMLGLSIPEAIPSTALEQQVLAVTTTSPVAPVIPLVQQPQRMKSAGVPRGYRMLAAAASVVLVAASIALGIRVVQLDGERDQAESQVAALSEAIEQAADPGSVLVQLLAPDGRAKGVVLAGRDEVLMVPTDLPVNPKSDHIYVLWGLRDGAPTALGGFDISDDTRVQDVVPSVADAGQYTRYAVTLEPGRYPPHAPTTDVIAMGEVKG
jgi:Anti-sigma-K factor rskA